MLRGSVFIMGGKGGVGKTGSNLPRTRSHISKDDGGARFKMVDECVEDWFDAMYEDVSATGARFTAVGVHFEESEPLKLISQGGSR